jgi:hypothetical protein
MNALVESIHASGCVEIQILKHDVFRAHLTVRFTSNAPDTASTHASNMAAAPARNAGGTIFD